MRAEDIITHPSLAEQLAAEAARLPAPPDEALAAVRELLARAERPPLDAAWPPFLRAAVEKKDSRYADPPHSHRPIAGPALVLAKRAFRLAFQPFINEVMRRQVEFNEALLNALATLHESQRENARIQALWRKELDARLSRLESSMGRENIQPQDSKRSSRQ